MADDINTYVCLAVGWILAGYLGIVRVFCGSESYHRRIGTGVSAPEPDHANGNVWYINIRLISQISMNPVSAISAC